MVLRRWGCVAIAWLLAGVPAAGAPVKVEDGRPDPAACSHREAGGFVVNGGNSGWQLKAFCTTGEGNLLAIVGAAERYGANVAVRPAAGGAVCVLDPAGKQLAQWPVEFTPQAIGLAPDGMVYVAGEGKIARFAADGRALGVVRSPHTSELDDTTALRSAAEKRLAEMRSMYDRTMSLVKDRIKTLSEKDPQALSAVEKTQLEQQKTILASYERMSDTYQKMSVEQVLGDITSRLTNISSISASEQDVFLACGETSGYGFSIWRLSADLREAKKIVTGLSGCCGQMDVQCSGGELYVAENSRFRVQRFDRDGKPLGSFGKGARDGAGGGFCSCCNPMNLCFSQSGDIFTSESNGTIKRFTRDGKFVENVGAAEVRPGCKRSTIARSPDESRFYYFDRDKSRIIVLARVESAGR